MKQYMNYHCLILLTKVQLNRNTFKSALLPLYDDALR